MVATLHIEMRETEHETGGPIVMALLSITVIICNDFLAPMLMLFALEPKILQSFVLSPFRYTYQNFGISPMNFRMI